MEILLYLRNHHIALQSYGLTATLFACVMCLSIYLSSEEYVYTLSKSSRLTKMIVPSLDYMDHLHVSPKQLI